ncbi:uncharacterized protein LOC123320154 [Coccinella septempunctata]|uniref:uncharacterized protein LOC123320154 n=1 Tax=Coccinella septempunctata TaxID=41139 RepID=UPI001D0725B4|nr:uncharacterized protein LOC123320154 [Coccinella septempunctata]
MSSDSGYEYECSRAELLGIPPPSYDEYLKNMAERSTNAEMENEKLEENFQETKKDDEEAKGSPSGKLNEINNILQSTQEKLNRFKTSYGSLTNAFKSKLGKSLDISFIQSQANGSRTNGDTGPSNTNRDKSEEPIIGSSMVDDKDSEMASNRTRQNGQSFDLSCGSSRDDDPTAYREVELNEDPNVDSKGAQEGKKFLNFGFLNLGGGK